MNGWEGQRGLASSTEQNVLLRRPQDPSGLLGQGAGYATGIPVQVPVGTNQKSPSQGWTSLIGGPAGT